MQSHRKRIRHTRHRRRMPHSPELPVYDTGSLPAASGMTGQQILVRRPVIGATVAKSNGTAWIAANGAAIT